MNHASIAPPDAPSLIDVPSTAYPVTHPRTIAATAPCEVCGRKKLGSYCRHCTEPPKVKNYRRPSTSVKEVWTCERCERVTALPLDEDGECSVCQLREPEIPVEEIYRRASIIRAGGEPDW